MPRPADKIFLRLATQSGYLSEEDADGIWGELTRLERDGQASKARRLAVEFGFMDKVLARQVKQGVREYLTDKMREESHHSRNDRRLAGFELLERLGSGAMGTVFKARHRKLNKIVGLKVLNPTFAADEKYVARFLLEARAAASLNHPNVVQAYDIGQSGDVHFIAMEYVEGKTVKELIDRRGFIDEAASIEIVLQVLSALHHAHENHLIHRDVKPANIMITGDGQAKLLDLGLARRTDVENGLTGEGKAIGTPYFMAPEQALDKGADYRADLYALGATLFNMVTGQKPYKAGTPVAVMNMHIKAPIPNASKLNDKVSEGLSKVIAKMLGKRPAERYQDHVALKADLEAVLSGFMPELNSGKAPVGISFIRPRGAGGADDRSAGSGSRTQRQRIQVPGGIRALQVAVAALVFFMVAGTLALTSKRSGGTPTDVVDVDEVENEDKPASTSNSEAEDTSERSARRLYAELTSGRNWQRVEELEELARSWPRTKVARQALDEAQGLRSELRGGEADRFDARTQELDRRAKEGDLLAAYDGYMALGRRLEDPDLRRKSLRRAEELKGVLDSKLATLQASAKALESEGRGREAAATWRKSAELLPKGERSVPLAHAQDLDRRATQRTQGASREARAARVAEAKQEEKDAAELPKTIVELVRTDRLQAAFDLAKAAGDRFQDAEAKALARTHSEALQAGLALGGLAVDAFAELKGETVTLERKRAAAIKGKVTAVEGDKITVALAGHAGAEVVVAVAELSEEESWRAIRKLMGARNPAYLKGVTVLKLYRGDADVEDYLERTDAAGIDLSALIKSLETLPQGIDTEATDQDSGDVSVAASSRRDDGRNAYDRAAKQNQNARWLIANRLKLFPEADVVGYADAELEPAYDFQENRNFGKDWRIVRGESLPTPPGAFDRIGLRLKGNGRAEFVAPLTGNLAIKLRFESQMFDARYGRLAITLDGEKGQRVSCEMGQLFYLERKKLKARQGDAQSKNVRSGTRNALELTRIGNELVAKFNGQVTAKLTLKKDLGVFRLGLEWNKAALDLASIRCMLSPEPRWVERVIGKPE